MLDTFSTPATHKDAKGWSPQKIRENLPFGAQARVAARIGVDPTTVASIVARKARSRKIEAALCQYLKAPREEVFGPNLRGGRPRKPVPTTPTHSEA